jgi:hypothetical protein
MQGSERQHENEADDEIDRGASERNDELLPRVGRHALHAGHAPNRQQGHCGRADAVAAGRKDVAELVQHHAGEDEDDEEGAVERGACAALPPGAEGDPGEQQEEGDVDPDLGAAAAADGDGPEHRSASRFRAQVPPPGRGAPF